MMDFGPFLDDETEAMFVYGEITPEGEVKLGSFGETDFDIMVVASRVAEWRLVVIRKFFQDALGYVPKIKVTDETPPEDFSGTVLFIDNHKRFVEFSEDWDMNSAVTANMMPILHIRSNPVGSVSPKKHMEMEVAHTHNQLVDAWERCRKMIAKKEKE